jgi:outer membrane protein assembly factor BamB
LSNDRNSENYGDFEALPPGTVKAYIRGDSLSFFVPDMNLSGNVNATRIAEQYVQRNYDLDQTEDPTLLDIGVEAALMEFKQYGSDILVIVILLDGQYGIVFQSATADGEMDQWRDTLIAIAASATLNPNAGVVAADAGPPAVAGAGPVAWQQQRPSNRVDDSGFDELGAVVISPDGTIYVADGTNGILILDADGSVTGTIINNTIRYIDDMKLAEDGTLWLVDSRDSRVYNLSTDGRMISSFGERGTGPGQFGEDSPRSFDIGADGNLYVFDTQPVSTNCRNAGHIQVFDTQGNFIRAFPTDPTDECLRISFIEIAFGPGGNIYASHQNQAMTIFDPQGTIIDANFGAATFQVNIPRAFDFGEDGLLYVATDNGLFVLNLTGAVMAQFGTPFPFPEGNVLPQPMALGEFFSPSGIGIAPNGDVIIADSNFVHFQIVRIRAAQLGL